MIPFGLLLLLFGAAIGMRCRIVALGFVVGVAGVLVLVSGVMSGSGFWASAGLAAYTAVMLQLGYLSSSLIAARFSPPRKSAPAPVCSHH